VTSFPRSFARHHMVVESVVMPGSVTVGSVVVGVVSVVVGVVSVTSGGGSVGRQAAVLRQLSTFLAESDQRWV
jgi:hypothetical protein